MKAAIASLEAIPIGHLLREPDLLLFACVAGVVGILLVPLPPAILDALLAINLGMSALVLASALMAERPLALSTFPTLLLVTTLFRLGLNVSTTRLILTTGHGGDVVDAFGRMVMRGDVVVGLLLFVIITLVQFLVIAKGSERVAEVGARFTLDAMPGKQMSIDAAVRSGAISEEEGELRRNELARESQFFGAMDGAMKFVRGDAIIGLVITALNLAAGFVIGVVRFGLSLSEAASTYSLLSAGDGLAAQIPALLITLSAGLLTTRVTAETPKGSKVGLGSTLGSELFSSPKALGVVALIVLGIGLLPALPLMPFALVSALLGLLTHRLLRRRVAMGVAKKRTPEETARAAMDGHAARARVQSAHADHMAPAAVPIAIELDPVLSAALGLQGSAADQDHELVSDLIPTLRDALYLDTGVRFPGVRVRCNVAGIPESSVVFRLKDVPVAHEVVDGGRIMVLETPERLEALGIDARACGHPLTGGKASLAPITDQAIVEKAGAVTWRPAGVVILHLARALRRHAKMFLGLQETSELLDRLSSVYPALVRETVPKVVTVVQLTDILRRLVDEHVCIRDLKSILEALSEHGAFENDGVALTELVRAALSLQIAHQYAASDRSISVLLLDPEIEEAVRSAVVRTASGSYLALEPDLRRAIVSGALRAIAPSTSTGGRPLILTSADVRRYVRKLLEDEVGDVPVLSFQELPSDLVVHPLGRIAIAGEIEAAA